MTGTTRTALLGLRGAQSWAGAPVGELRAFAWSTRLDVARAASAVRARGMEQRLVAEASRGQNGVCAWHGLPGFGAWAAGPLPTDPVTDPWDAAFERPYTIVVCHPSFLAARLAVVVPHQDLLSWTWGAGDERPFVPLYPAPTHPTPDGYVAVRATLWDPERNTPAAWALLDVSANGHRSTGLAGEDGQVTVFLPQPRPRAGIAPTAQRWVLQVRVRYARLVDLRSAAPPLLSSSLYERTPPGRLRADLPNLDLVEAQPIAVAHATWTSVAVHTPFVAPDLTPGGECLLASAPQPPAVPLASRETRLFITP